MAKSDKVSRKASTEKKLSPQKRVGTALARAPKTGSRKTPLGPKTAGALGELVKRPNPSSASISTPRTVAGKTVSGKRGGAVSFLGATVYGTTFSEVFDRDAKVLRAAEDLNRIRKMRLVARALNVKTSQDEIAATLGISQPTVSRIARQIRNNPRVLDESPIEIIEQRAVGEIDDDAMMNALLARSYTHGEYDPTPAGDGYLSGTFDEIQTAAGRGLLTREEYDLLVARADIRGR